MAHPGSHGPQGARGIPGQAAFPVSTGEKEPERSEQMSEQETEILRDAFKFLKTFSDAPRLDGPDSEQYWLRAADALTAIGNKWRHHPLVEKVLVGIYEYLEIKQKELSK